MSSIETTIVFDTDKEFTTLVYGDEVKHLKLKSIEKKTDKLDIDTDFSMLENYRRFIHLVVSENFPHLRNKIDIETVSIKKEDKLVYSFTPKIVMVNTIYDEEKEDYSYEYSTSDETLNSICKSFVNINNYRQINNIKFYEKYSFVDTMYHARPYLSLFAMLNVLYGVDTGITFKLNEVQIPSPSVSIIENILFVNKTTKTVSDNSLLYSIQKHTNELEHDGWLSMFVDNLEKFVEFCEKWNIEIYNTKIQLSDNHKDDRISHVVLYRYNKNYRYPFELEFINYTEPELVIETLVNKKEFYSKLTNEYIETQIPEGYRKVVKEFVEINDDIINVDDKNVSDTIVVELFRYDGIIMYTLLNCMV